MLEDEKRKQNQIRLPGSVGVEQNNNDLAIEIEETDNVSFKILDENAIRKMLITDVNMKKKI